MTSCASTLVWALLDLTDRELAADVLRQVLTSDGPAPRSVWLRGATLTGELNLQAAALRCPLLLEGCEFREPITLDEATAPSIRLLDSTILQLTAAQLETRVSVGGCYSQ